MTPITALEAIKMLRILGLSVRTDGEKLFVSPADLIDEDVAWLIRKHRDGILAELENDSSPAWAWLVRFNDGSAKEIYRHPPATRAEVLAAYPGTSIERLPEFDWPHDPKKGGRNT